MLPTPVPSAAHSPLYAWSTARQTGPPYGPVRSPPYQSQAHHADQETSPPRSSTDRFRSRTGGIHRSTLHLSLSRLNHWLPWGQAHPEVLQGTAEFHHEIAAPVLPQPEPVLDDTPALDAAVDLLDRKRNKSLC